MTPWAPLLRLVGDRVRQAETQPRAGQPEAVRGVAGRRTEAGEPVVVFGLVNGLRPNDAVLSEGD